MEVRCWTTTRTITTVKTRTITTTAAIDHRYTMSLAATGRHFVFVYGKSAKFALAVLNVVDGCSLSARATVVGLIPSMVISFTRDQFSARKSGGDVAGGGGS